MCSECSHGYAEVNTCVNLRGNFAHTSTYVGVCACQYCCSGVESAIFLALSSASSKISGYVCECKNEYGIYFVLITKLILKQNSYGVFYKNKYSLYYITMYTKQVASVCLSNRRPK